MATQPGDRIEFGSEVEPCGGIVQSVCGETVVFAWDTGGTSVVSAALLSLLSCDRITEHDAVRLLVG